jgi:hypothetical protein
MRHPWEQALSWSPKLQIWERGWPQALGWSPNLQIWERGWPQPLKAAFPNLKIWTPATSFPISA